MAGQETVKIHKMIDGVLHPFEFKRARFEHTIDRIDHDVQNGASHAQILKKYGHNIVNHGSSLVSQSESPSKPAVTGDKKAFVRDTYQKNPGMPIAHLIKHISAQSGMTAANARYLLMKVKSESS